MQSAPGQKLHEARSRGGCGTTALGCLGIVLLALIGSYIIDLLGTNSSKTSPTGGRPSPAVTTLYSTLSSLNVRAEPNVNAEIVGRLGYGEAVRVTAGTDTSGGEHAWVKIEQGWVVKDYLSKDRPLSDKEKLAGQVPKQSGWNGSYSEVKDYLRQVMHDPSSLEWEGCTKVFWEQSKQAYLVGCIYRGNNAFGGKVKNSNWFVIRHGQVIEMKDADAYAWK